MFPRSLQMKTQQKQINIPKGRVWPTSTKSQGVVGRHTLQQPVLKASRFGSEWCPDNKTPACAAVSSRTEGGQDGSVIRTSFTMHGFKTVLGLSLSTFTYQLSKGPCSTEHHWRSPPFFHPWRADSSWHVAEHFWRKLQHFVESKVKNQQASLPTPTVLWNIWRTWRKEGQETSQICRPTAGHILLQKGSQEPYVPKTASYFAYRLNSFQLHNSIIKRPRLFSVARKRRWLQCSQEILDFEDWYNWLRERALILKSPFKTSVMMHDGGIFVRVRPWTP